MSTSQEKADHPPPNGTRSPASMKRPSPPQPQRTLFSVPAPIKALFDRFPLHTYPPNPKPLSSIDNPQVHTLHIHSTPAAAARGEPAPHPGSLKWQTLLRIYGIPVTLRASTTHASPNSALPFLLPASSPHSLREPLTISTLPSWIRAQSSVPARAPANALHEALLRPLRAAYLHAVYLTPVVFATRTKAVHIDTATSIGVVQDVLAWQLQNEAADEITGGSGAVWPVVDAAAVYAEAAEALAALGVVLGDSRWFGRRKEAPEERISLEDEGVGNWEVPGLLDAGVFGYTHVIMEMLEGLPEEKGTEGARGLVAALREQDNLVEHRERVLRKYYS